MPATGGRGTGGSGSRAASRRRSGVLVPGTTIKKSTPRLRVPSAPLLEEERDRSGDAGISNALHPFFRHGTRSWTRFAPRDHPVNAVQVGGRYRSEQRFEGNELQACARSTMVIDSGKMSDRFSRSLPSTDCVATAADPRGCAIAPTLFVSTWNVCHGALLIASNTLLDECNGDPLVEQVAHRVHEDPARFFPPRGKRQQLGVHRRLESVSVARLPHGEQSRRHSFRIAVQAAFADLRAAGHRVPGTFRPFDPVSARVHSLRICWAILTATGAPLSFAAAKHRRYIGLFREFRKTRGLSATPGNRQRRRSRKKSLMRSKSVSF